MKVKRVQIELTTGCNLSCEYCFRNWLKADGIDLTLVEKLVGTAKEYVLYGFGEPLLHSNLPKIVDMLDGRIVVSTNGMLDFDVVAETADVVGISIDFDENLRKGLKLDEVVRKLRKLEDKGVLQVVVTRNNIDKVPALFELAASFGLDFLATNVVANTERIYEERVYFEGSRINVELAKDLDEKIILEAIHDYSKGHGKAAELYREVLRRAYGAGYSINVLSIFESRETINLAFKAEKLFAELEDKAKELGIEFEGPKFFGDARGRECPYNDSVFVRVDGQVSVCMSLAHDHVEFINGHAKNVSAYIPANLKSSDFDCAVNAIDEFNELRKDMDNFPWCSDCPYVAGCWYAERSFDCYTNEPSCSECLYSVGIAKCLLG